MKRRFSYLFGALLIAVSLAGNLQADEPGLPDLDKATELRLGARTPQDLLQVAELCETAIRKGLDDDNKTFAKQLAAGALFDLSSRIASFVLDTSPPDPRWQLFRHRALQSLEKTVEYDPESADAHLLIGRLQVLQPGGDQKRARSAADAAIELFEKKKDGGKLSKAYALRGRLKEKPEDRLADFAKALEYDETNADALEGQARVYMSQGKVDEGLATFDKLLNSSEDKFPIRMTIAEALLGLDRLDDALEQTTKAIEESEGNTLAYTMRARIHAMREDAKAALADLDAALKADGNNMTALVIRCELHLVESNFDKARQDAEALLKARPGLALAFRLRSRISSAEAQDAKDKGKKTVARMKFAEAARDIRLLLQHEPNNHEWRLQLAAIYSTDDQPRRAIREIDKVLQKDTDNWLALRTRGDAFLSIGEHKRAIADYEEALKLQPKNSGILNNLAWVLATSPKDDVRDGKRAIELAQKACEETDFKAAHILSTLASGYAEIGDFETARKWSAKAVELGEESLKSQLQEELDSYKASKPWRELQQTEESPDFETPAGQAVET